MSKNKYSLIEIEILNSNPNVIMVKYGRQIEYNEQFKKWAVLQSLNHPELSANQIFEAAGFDLNIIGKRTADSRIRNWKNKYLKNNEIIYKPVKPTKKKSNSLPQRLFIILGINSGRKKNR